MAKGKGGRPTKYDEDLAHEIVHRLVGPPFRSLRSVCEDPDMPAVSTVLRWAIEDDNTKPWHGFSEHYAQARRMQALIWAEETIEIADNESKDWHVDEDGNLHIDREMVARSRLRVDTRKWVLSKVLPKVYGDKVSMEHTGPDGGPVHVAVTRKVVGSKNRVAAYTNGNGKP